MTEAEWLACADPGKMVNRMRKKASDRKVRLFGCACCRRIWHLLSDKRSRNAVSATERYADGVLSAEQLSSAELKALDAIRLPLKKALRKNAKDMERMLAVAAAAPWVVAGKQPAYAMDWVKSAAMVKLRPAIAPGATARSTPAQREAEKAMDNELCVLLHDIFGNPFRPLPPRSEAIAPLAEQIYADAWDQMPILGEWLQEHGYWSEGEHCLDPSIHHVKGCWVVDWVTGRE
jgi:hypothetical protein